MEIVSVNLIAKRKTLRVTTFQVREDVWKEIEEWQEEIPEEVRDKFWKEFGNLSDDLKGERLFLDDSPAFRDIYKRMIKFESFERFRTFPVKFGDKEGKFLIELGVPMLYKAPSIMTSSPRSGRKSYTIVDDLYEIFKNSRESSLEQFINECKEFGNSGFETVGNEEKEKEDDLTKSEKVLIESYPLALDPGEEYERLRVYVTKEDWERIKAFQNDKKEEIPSLGQIDCDIIKKGLHNEPAYKEKDSLHISTRGDVEEVEQRMTLLKYSVAHPRLTPIFKIMNEASYAGTIMTIIGEDEKDDRIGRFVVVVMNESIWKKVKEEKKKVEKVNFSKELLNKRLPFVIDGVKFQCIRQYVEYKKALLFGDYEMVKKVMSSSLPWVLKELGLKSKRFSKEMWERYRDYYVIEALKAVFEEYRKDFDFLDKLTYSTIRERYNMPDSSDLESDLGENIIAAIRELRGLQN